MLFGNGALAMKICSAEGCHRRMAAKSFCRKHYQRWRVYGRTNRVLNYERHGYSEHPLAITRSNMLQRCKRNPLYVDRGIKVCREWYESTRSFVEWGVTNDWQEGLTIDRIDPFGDYEPSNCQFLTFSENSRRVIHQEYLYSAFNKTQSLTKWASDTGIPYATIWSRINNLSWPIARAVTQPVFQA